MISVDAALSNSDISALVSIRIGQRALTSKTLQEHQEQAEKSDRRDRSNDLYKCAGALLRGNETIPMPEPFEGRYPI
jgi:hypothetical protein